MELLDTHGCIFCSEKGSGDHINSGDFGDTSKNHQPSKIPLETLTKSISNQVENYFKSYKAERANKFIAYFQNFTNTYDTVENLKKKYDAALIDNRIVALAIATRPDCINEEIVKLLKSYTEKYYVWVELGLQTSNDETGKIINRCYSSEQFTKAVELLNKYNIDVVTHIMIGLPNETHKDIENTVNFINNHQLMGLKIHSTYIVKNTTLNTMYENGEYTPITFEYYMQELAYVISHINPELVIHRISGDAPKDILVAPEWNIHKKWFLNGLDKLLKEQDLWQGKYY